MKTSFGRAALCLCALVGSTLGGRSAEAQTQENWCERDRVHIGGHSCEVREYLLPAAPGRLVVEPRPNGGIEVQGSDREDILVIARVTGHALTGSETEGIVAQIDIVTRDGRVRAVGPRERRGWAVDYRIFVPYDYDLELESTNGHISVTQVRGRVTLKTINGGLQMREVSGVVLARTTNGDVSVLTSHSEWDARGVEIQTTNGDISLHVGEEYDADLLARMMNGALSTDLPLDLRSATKRELNVRLGRGGAPIRLITTNGDIRIHRLSDGDDTEVGR